MKRPRPYISLAVRVEVASRQLAARHLDNYGALAMLKIRDGGAYQRLGDLLFALFAMQPVHLDHDPPLRSRTLNKRTGKYSPDANDPAHLIYRTAEAHQFKTNVRGDGAQFPDRVLIKRERNREKKEAEPKKRRPPMGDREREHMSRALRRAWAEGRRRWPQGIKIRSRGFQ